jgi:hypothetical protein
MTVHVSGEVRERVYAVARWYDAQQGQYGAAFLDEFQAALLRIESAPRACSPSEDGRPGHEDREFFIERFKQRVIFTIVGEDAYVLAVVHASRREGAWHRNLPTDLPPETS